jgi:hypothetical protein
MKRIILLSPDYDDLLAASNAVWCPGQLALNLLARFFPDKFHLKREFLYKQGAGIFTVGCFHQSIIHAAMQNIECDPTIFSFSLQLLITIRFTF